jgi:hypothetical protein
MSDESDDERTAMVISRLVNAGWERTTSSETLDYANLLYETETAELEVDWMPEDEQFTVRFEGEDDEHELAIEFGTQLSSLVDLLVDVQDELSSSTWEAFVQSVVQRFPHSWEVFGDDDMRPLGDDR